MKHHSGFNNLTTVDKSVYTVSRKMRLVILVCALVLGFPGVGFGTDTPAPTPPAAGAPGAPDSGALATALARLGTQPVNECRQFMTDFTNASRKVRQYCGTAVNRDCIQRINGCTEKINDLVSQARESRDSQTDAAGSLTQTALSALGNAMGTNLSSAIDTSSSLRGIAEGCPRLAGRDYQDRKRNLERDLKDAEKDLTDNQKKIEDAQKKLGEETAKLQRNRVEAESNFEKLKLELDQTTRESIERVMQNQARLATQIRTVNANILQKRAQLNAALRNHTRQMLQFSNEVFQRTCLGQVEEYRKKRYGEQRTGGNKMDKFFDAGSKRKTDLQAIYDSCFQDLDQQKIAALEQARTSQETIQQEIATMESELVQVNDDLIASRNDVTRLNQEKGDQTNRKQQELIEEITTIQQELENLQNTTQTELRNIANEQRRIETRINIARVELASLGPEPSDSTLPSFSETSAALEELNEISGNFRGTQACASICDGANKPAICMAETPATPNQNTEAGNTPGRRAPGQGQAPAGNSPESATTTGQQPQRQGSTPAPASPPAGAPRAAPAPVARPAAQ